MVQPASRSVADQLLDLLLEQPDAGSFLSGAVSVAAEALELGPPGGCSVLVERARRAPLSARTDSLGAGPAMTEYGPGSPGRTVLGGGPDVVLGNLPAGRQWAAGAMDAGIRSMAAVALPLSRESGTRQSGTRESGTRESGTRESGTRERRAGENRAGEVRTAGERGVLICYSEHAHAFGPREVTVLRMIAAETAKLLRLALLLDAQSYRAANLQAALESRTVVDLAAGIIMGQNNCSQQAAIDILRNVSNSRNIKIRDVAAGIVAAVSDRVETHFEE